MQGVPMDLSVNMGNNLSQYPQANLYSGSFKEIDFSHFS